jgi:hypothetical protein
VEQRFEAFDQRIGARIVFRSLPFPPGKLKDAKSPGQSYRPARRVDVMVVRVARLRDRRS